MNVGYLINQYPRVSHSFIRREIAALEQCGVVVHRFSIRPCQDELADARDRAEIPKTTVILASKVRVVVAAFAASLRSPLRFARALREALRLHARSDRGLVAHMAYLAEACVLLGELRRREIRHLHAHFGTNPAAVALLCRLLGGPDYSFTVHGPEEFDKAPLLALDRKIAKAKFVVAISEFGRSQLLRLLQAEQFSKIQVVRCGLDVDLLNAAQEPIPDVARLVCIGRLSEQKGHSILLEAAARMAKDGKNFELVLVGGGELRDVLERRMQALGLDSHVRITGFVSQERVVEELRAARALVLPSLGEGLPVVIMEAFALGRPVLSTFIAGIPELVTPGQSGWLVPAGSVEALAAALADVLSCPIETLEKMAAQGKQAVRQRHDVHASAHRLVQLFEGT
jgi:glycosyltransferase involved in cell wall biosynthesis